jgi:hypothetical protein
MRYVTVYGGVEYEDQMSDDSESEFAFTARRGPELPVLIGVSRPDDV